MQLEDDQQPTILVSPVKEKEGPLYAILHTQPVTPVRRQSIVTLHPIESGKDPAKDESSQNQQKNNQTNHKDAGPSR